MKSSKILKEERTSILNNMESLVEQAETENRQLTDAEKTSYRNWKTEAENIGSDIDLQQDIEKRKAEKATAKFSINTQKRNKFGEAGEKSTLAI